MLRRPAVFRLRSHRPRIWPRSDRLLDGRRYALRELNAELIAVLEDEGWVTSEAQQNRRRAVRTRARRDRQQLFGAPVGGLAGAPASDLPPLAEEEEDQDSAIRPAAEAEPPVEAPPQEPVAEESPVEEEEQG